MYRQDFWKFSKQCCQGTIDDAIQKPTFTKPEADDYYPKKYSNAKPLIDEKIRWFPQIPSETTDTSSHFDLSPIRPKLIKQILANKKATSAPGPDGLIYGLLRKLPCTQHFMSTLFTKLLISGEPPESWSSSRVSLIYKANSTADPANFRMISLTPCVGKLFHQIMAERTATFLCKNGIIDDSTQKAFLRGINGCIEHTQTMHELLASARLNKKTIHITFFDLADAFGSVEHDLIYKIMAQYRFPPVISMYVRNLYGRLNGCVTGPNWTSEKFAFKRSVFQGDPWSPILFLMVFNPIVQYIKTHEEKSGYSLNGFKYITLPFADDFCLISTNKLTHQRLIHDINEKLISMNLLLKPSKCRSISICSGKPKPITFCIGDTPPPNGARKARKIPGFLHNLLRQIGRNIQHHIG